MKDLPLLQRTFPELAAHPLASLGEGDFSRALTVTAAEPLVVRIAKHPAATLASSARRASFPGWRPGSPFRYPFRPAGWTRMTRAPQFRSIG